MKVDEILQRKTLLLGKRLHVEGYMIGQLNVTETGFNEEAWLVSDRLLPWGRANSILIKRRGLLDLLNRTITPRFGGPAYNEVVEIDGVLSQSPDPRFALSLEHITKLQIDRNGEVTMFDFSDKKWRRRGRK